MTTPATPPTPPTPAGGPGRRRIGTLLLGQLLGTSALGRTYRADENDTAVAVLLVRSDLQRDPNRVDALLRGQLTLRNVVHPNVLHLQRVEASGDELLVVHDLPAVSGTLADRLTGRPAPLPQALAWLRGAAAGLAALHAAGVVHGALGPEQILLPTPDGAAAADADGDRAQITGFGIATALRAPDALTAAVLPAENLAPEVALGGPDSAAADVFALGASMFRLCTGQAPYPAAHALDRVRAQTEDALRMPEDLPGPLTGLLRGMLSPHPGDRPDASEVSRSLQTLSGTTDLPPEPAPPEPAPSVPAPTEPELSAPASSRRVRAAVAAAVTALLVVTLGIGAAVIRSGSNDEPVATATAGSSPALSSPAVGGPAPSGSAATGSSSSGASAGSSSGPKLTRMVIASDLALRGVEVPYSVTVNNALKLYLSSIGNKVNGIDLQFKEFNLADIEGSAYLSACRSAAAAHIADPNTVVVLGPALGYGECAKELLPRLNSATGGPLLTISHELADPGFTLPWLSGEPGVYRPTGTPNFARVIPSDAVLPSAAISYATETLKARRVFVITDAAGAGDPALAALEKAAAAAGVEIVGRERWGTDSTRTDPLFTRMKTARPDLVYVLGPLASSSTEILAGKRSALGSGTDAAKLVTDVTFASTAAATAPDLAEGVIVPIAGLGGADLFSQNGPGRRFAADYKARYGTDLTEGGALYAVLALQAAVKAIAASDGTRAGVNRAVFGATALTIPASESITGRAVTINPATGDVISNDVSIMQISSGSFKQIGKATVDLGKG